MSISIRKRKNTVKINMAKTNSWTEKDFIKDIDMNSHAKNAIVKELKFRLRLTTPYRMLKIQYFFTYALNPNKVKIPNCLYARQGNKRPFVKITKNEMFISNASSHEYAQFLELLGAKKITDTKKILETVKL
jgi:hypothetical protein|tara:strand:+ start:153 stop:548 length:396 start_codon:yes stop_codon:yes gene_type:complete